MKMLLILLLICSQVSAQSTAKVPSNPESSSTTVLPALSWERIKSKLKVNYFNFATGPNIKKIDDNETKDNGDKDLVPTAMYHSFLIRYNLIGNLDLLLTPRFATPMGDDSDLRPGMDDHQGYVQDDFDAGLFYSFVNQPSFNYGQSLVVRFPFSYKARGEQVDKFYVWQSLVNWSISPKWRLLHWTVFTYYDFNNQATIERYRALARNLLNYSFNDKWMMQFGYEIDMQHVNPYDNSNPNNRDANFFKRYHSYTTLGVGYSPVHSWTLLPYIRTLDERNIRPETTTVGFMIMGKII